MGNRAYGYAGVLARILSGVAGTYGVWILLSALWALFPWKKYLDLRERELRPCARDRVGGRGRAGHLSLNRAANRERIKTGLGPDLWRDVCATDCAKNLSLRPLRAGMRY